MDYYLMAIVSSLNNINFVYHKQLFTDDCCNKWFFVNDIFVFIIVCFIVVGGFRKNFTLIFA